MAHVREDCVVEECLARVLWARQQLANIRGVELQDLLLHEFGGVVLSEGTKLR